MAGNPAGCFVQTDACAESASMIPNGVVNTDDRMGEGVRMSGLPLPRLAAPVAACSSFWAVSTIDHSGRLADRSSLRHLGWLEGDAVRVRVREDFLIVVERGGSACAVSAQGHLRLPIAARRRCHIGSGDRLLVLAWKDSERLVICPSTALNSLLGERIDAVVEPGTTS